VAPPRRSRRPRTTLLLLILAAVTIITLDARGGFHEVTSGVRSAASDAFAPVRSGVNAVVEPIGSFLAGSVHYGAVREQNQKLQAEIDRLKMQSAASADQAEAYSQLYALLHLPYLANLQSVPAEVTDFGTSDFAATIDIDVGRSDGVQLGMPVVGNGGLVGQVVEVSHHTATVRLITDGQSSVGVQFGPPPGLLAVLDGEGAGKPLSGEFIPTNTALTNGEIFTTSGLQGAVFPPGIPVARVVASHTGSSASQESVSLQPLANLTHLRYVTVVLWGPSP
jgi:rod shape-determining protein MreC